MIEALAAEARAPLVTVSPSNILSKYYGESESAIKQVFRRAVEQALQCPARCAVVFFDEIDALGESRAHMGSGEGEGCSRRVLTELLMQLNHINSHTFVSIDDFGGALASEQTDGVRIIMTAATNRTTDMDPALLRRFGIQLYVGLPKFEDRKEMIARFIGSVPNEVSPKGLEKIAKKTEGWSGSKLKNLAREAAMRPVHECMRNAMELRHEERQGGASEDSAAVAADTKLKQELRNLRAVTDDDFFRPRKMKRTQDKDGGNGGDAATEAVSQD